MLYAVELYFDKDTEEKIMRLPQAIAEKGLSTRYLEWKFYLHKPSRFFYKASSG